MAYFESGASPVITRTPFDESNLDTVSKAGVLSKLYPAVGILAATGYIGYTFFNIWLYFIALIAGIAMIFAARNPERAPKMLFAYAIAEGYVLGGFSKLILERYEEGFGLVLLSTIVVGSIFAGTLLAYNLGLINYSQKFVNITKALTISMLIFFVAAITTGIFGESTLIDFYTGASLESIGLSVVFVGIAFNNLVVDFMFLRKAEESELPKELEWFLALGILVSLAFLYIEVIRLIGKILGRR